MMVFSGGTPLSGGFVPHFFGRGLQGGSDSISNTKGQGYPFLFAWCPEGLRCVLTLARLMPRKVSGAFPLYYPHPLMKTSPIITLALLLLSITTFADVPEGWTDNYAKAMKQAKAENKHVLLDFTGSDWCSWCIKLDHEIFDKASFKSFAKDTLVLVKVDFPESTPIAAKTKAQNEKLQKQFRVSGYPTLFILDADGKQVWEGGYMEGGPDAFIKATAGVLKKKE